MDEFESLNHSRCTRTGTKGGAERFAGTLSGHSNTDRDVAPRLIAMRLDPTAQKIGVESVSQRNRRDQYARLQAGRNYPCFELRRVPPIPPRCRRYKCICVHVSTKNTVDTIVASDLSLDKVG